jgi:hypothetical protein
MALNNARLAAIAEELKCPLSLVEVIAEPVRYIREKVRPNTDAETNDVFMTTLFPELASYTRASRSVSSMMGSQFYPRLARALASYRYGANACPRVIPGGGVTPDELANYEEPKGTDVLIVSRIESSRVEGLARRLQGELRTGQCPRVGTPEFSNRLRDECGYLLQDVSARDHLWSTRTDFYVDDIGLIEIESSGMLDSASVIGQVTKLLRAGIALARPEVSLYWALAYSHAGDRQPSTPLTKYLEIIETPQGSQGGLLIGRHFWERLLPDDVSFDTLLGVIQAVRELPS